MDSNCQVFVPYNDEMPGFDPDEFEQQFKQLFSSLDSSLTSSGVGSTEGAVFTSGKRGPSRVVYLSGSDAGAVAQCVLPVLRAAPIARGGYVVTQDASGTRKEIDV